MSEQSNVPQRIADLIALVASGDASMSFAKEKMRNWYLGLPPEEQKLISANRSAIGRRMMASAEGLAQELVVLTANQS